MVKSGDVCKVVCDGVTYTGVCMPDSDVKVLRLKLDSGYNVGLLRKKISKLSVVKKKVAKKKKVSSVRQRSKLPHVAILHTGGTVASKVDYTTGGVSAQFSDAELLALFPKLKEVAHISSRFLSNMFSEDIHFAHINQIAKAVHRELKKKDVVGVVVTHGTDTLAFSAAALSFMFSGLQKPVVFVGAQRSSDRGSSDAYQNLLCAVQFATHAKCGEVVVCMHESSDDALCAIHRGVNVKKLHTSRRDAFCSVNAEPLATIDTRGNMHAFSTFRVFEGKLKLDLLNERLNIGVVVSRPNMRAQDVLAFEKCNGVVVLGSGLGHLPVNVLDTSSKVNQSILRAVKKLAKKMPVVMTSNCVYGRVNMNVYATGRKLQDGGVLGDGLSMHFDVAYMKLAYLLSCQKKNVASLYVENLRGEINSRSLYKP